VTKADLFWLRKHTNAEGRDAIAFARQDADSGLESLFRWRLRPYGLSVRSQESIVSVGRVDFLIGERLIVEVDGASNHDGVSHRHRDLVRDAHAAAWGFVTLRFDYAMVVRDWETVERAILAHVGRGLHRA
jgi:very-short-patch-repair endonuclease